MLFQMAKLVPVLAGIRHSSDGGDDLRHGEHGLSVGVPGRWPRRDDCWHGGRDDSC